MEIKKEEVSPYVDVVITFEELQALFDSRDILLANLESESIKNAFAVYKYSKKVLS